MSGSGTPPPSTATRATPSTSASPSPPPATTHRGLYVATTRGRDDNRIHVVTDTADLAEARDVLDAVLAHDRADVPAVAQRRLLAQTAEGHRSRAHDPVPDWVEPWRLQLQDRREPLINRLNEREGCRVSAQQALVDLEPVLQATRAVWAPYEGPMRDLERALHDKLQPGAQRARESLQNTRLGRRHVTQREAADAAQAVEHAEAALAKIRRDGAPIEHQLDMVETQARKLRERAEPGVETFDLHDRNEISQLDRILDATDTYMRWLDGRPTSSARLALAVETLSDVARHAPNFARQAGDVDRSRWYELLELAPDHLDRRLAHDRPQLEIELGR